MTPERYIITRTVVTPQTRLYAAEPLGVRLTVVIADSAPTVALMHATDATEEGAVRRLSAQIVLEFMQGKFCVGPAGLPPGAVHERVLAALVEARAKRNSDRDRAVHYLSILGDEIREMQAEAKARAGELTLVFMGDEGEGDGGGAQAGEQVPPRSEPSEATPPHREVIEPAQHAATVALPPVAQAQAPATSAAPPPADGASVPLPARGPAAPAPATPALAAHEARPPSPSPSPVTQRRDSDITEGLRPLPVPPSPDGLTGTALRDALRRRWQAVAHVGTLSSPDGRLMLWSASHTDLAIKMATQDRRWWEIGAVGQPTADFIRDAFARWVVSREGRRVEAFEQSTIDKLWDPYCRFMVGDPATVHPVMRTHANFATSTSTQTPEPSAEGLAGEEAPHHDD